MRGLYDSAVPRAAVSTSPPIELEYETFGDPADPTVLLIAGWGAQLITWHEDFCRELVRRGYHAVRFDNRDAGLSTRLSEHRPPTVGQIIRRDASAAAYTLDDLADDGVGLLDSLGVDRAHVVGASMGGMIAQTVAIDHRDRVATLTSIMSTTGDPSVGNTAASVAGLLNRPAAQTRDERVAMAVETSRVLWGDTPQVPFDEELARWRAEVSDARCFHPPGRSRQLLAIHASGDRTPALRELRDLPTLVVHGDNDPLIDVSGGHATAAAIPGAELIVIEGLGHVVARVTWPRILDAFDRLVARAAPATAT